MKSNILKQLMYDLDISIGDIGYEPLKIPACSFCREYLFYITHCLQCEYGQVFGECNETGSHWDTINDKVAEILRKVAQKG